MKTQPLFKKLLPKKALAERVVNDIRRHFSAEDKIRPVLDGLRGEYTIAELCRKDTLGLAIAASGCDSAIGAAQRKRTSQQRACTSEGH